MFFDFFQYIGVMCVSITNNVSVHFLQSSFQIESLPSASQPTSFKFVAVDSLNELILGRNFLIVLISQNFSYILKRS